MVKRVGVIGGGQLAWMMADGAKKLGLELVVQTPSGDDPAVAIATYSIFAAIDDATATAQLADRAEVITFENEFIDLIGLSHLADRGVQFCPSLQALTPLLDKFDQRSYLQQHGLPTPEFRLLQESSEIAALGFPVVLKARRHGYDGKGTFIVRTPDAFPIPRDAIAPDQWLLEAFVPFQGELAVMAARSPKGEIAIYPVVETQQVDQVCRRVFVTSDWSLEIVEQVNAIARTLLTSLNFVGIMGIEFFLTPEGKVLVNETAPRTHNSGHYSLDACVTSQFEQQLRCVSNLPLGDPSLNCPGAVMINLLGHESMMQNGDDRRQTLTQIPNAHLYWYNKTPRPGRKLGHVTVTLEAGQGRAEAEEMGRSVEEIWYG
jgi:5-(carboxyamino)imidazole ribonucleotide synthase